MTELQNLTFKETKPESHMPIGLSWLEYKNKGGMYYAYEADCIVIKGIYVFEKHRNKGVGHRLIGMLYDKAKKINEKEHGHIQRISINTNSNGQYLFDSLLKNGVYKELVTANIDFGNMYRKYHFIFDGRKRGAFVRTQKNKESKDYFVSGFKKELISKDDKAYRLVCGKYTIEPLYSKSDIVPLFNGASLVKNWTTDTFFVIKDGAVLFCSKFLSPPQYDENSKLLSFSDYDGNDKIINLTKKVPAA